jgi:hypothetical protein
MLKFFSMLKTASEAFDDHSQAATRWQRDPLQHPDLARMEERELADLPFPGWPWPRATADNTCDCR